jgi:hypothetical protein
MQITIDIGYDQVFQLVRQLSPREQVRLFHDSVSSIVHPSGSEPEISDEAYYEFLVNFPVVSEGEISQILEAKKEVDQCCPVSQ